MRRGLLASRDELRSLRSRVARKPFDTIFEMLQLRCSLILESAPVAESQWQALWSRGGQAAPLTAARTAQGRILDLIVAHHIEPNLAFRDRAIEELRNLAGWTSWTDPSHDRLSADMCTAEAGVALAVGLDWLWEDLDEPFRDRLIDAIRRKAIEPYRKAVGQGAWWYNCYHSWNAVVNGGCGLAALALSDEDKSARDALKLARAGLKPFFAALGAEGGWDEGLGPWGVGMRSVLLLAEALRRTLDDERLFHARGMEATGLFPIFFTPNGRAANFGNAPAVPLYGAFYLLAQQFDRPEVTWWLDTYALHRDVSTSGWASAGLSMLFRPEGRSPAAPALPPVKVYDDIGWAAMADRWPNPAFYVAAKTGDLSANDSQRDMNALQLQVDGEMLLTDMGNTYANHGSAHSFYDVQARAHNTVLVAENDHQIDAQGAIVDSGAGKNYRYLAADAKDACGENARFVRQMVMVLDARGKGRMLVVLDEIDSGSPEKIEVFWHTLGRVELDAAARTGRIAGNEVALNFAFAASVPVTVQCRGIRIDRQRRDSILRIAGGALGTVQVVSVFSREALTEPVELSSADAGLAVTAGGVALAFRRQRGRLKLDSVTKNRKA
ncbi:MAG: heparinase II/III family protein [Planctomycetota bacterium]|nr:heparinase II/III family protein [Planctomycetota bacterium]